MLHHIERTNTWSAWKTPPSTLWSVDLDQKVFEVLEDERSKGRPVLNQLLLVCNIMFLCQYLGMAPEEGHICNI